MKYIIILTILFTSCNDSVVSNPNNPNNQFIRQDGIHNTSINVYDFKFREHDYLQFGYSSSSTIVHNPDCKICKK